MSTFLQCLHSLFLVLSLEVRHVVLAGYAAFDTSKCPRAFSTPSRGRAHPTSFLTNKAGEANYGESSKGPAHANVDPQVRSDCTAKSGAASRKPVTLLVKVDDREECVE